jgi:hypothetical protein
MRRNLRFIALPVGILAAMFIASGARAQVTPAQGYEPVDDTPLVKLGGTIFADYTYQDKPKVTDSNKNTIHQSSFNVSRAYINVTGNISHLVAYRITPDIKTDTNDPATDKSLSGSSVFRLKYAYGQINLDDWIGKGAWLRIGAQQTPLVDFQEGIYRYRFQGPVFVDREGFLTSSDFGLSAHYALPNNFGDLHVGVYNGEGYSSQADATGANDQKALQARLTIRPAPGVPILKGLRLTGFIDGDDYVQKGAKQRLVGQVTFEHPFVNASFEYLDSKDRKTPAVADIHATGWSAWANPKTPFGLEALLRYEELKPNKDVSAKKKRFVGGVSYWFPVQKGVTTAIMADYEQVKYDTALGKPKEQRWALHTLFNF